MRRRHNNASNTFAHISLHQFSIISNGYIAVVFNLCKKFSNRQFFFNFKKILQPNKYWIISLIDFERYIILKHLNI